MTKIRADEKRLKEFAERSHEGELLKANLGKMRKGMATIEVLDWNSGQNRKVALDPALSPIENMERIFKKSAKGKRGERAVGQRLSETLEEKQALEDLPVLRQRRREHCGVGGNPKRIALRRPGEV